MAQLERGANRPITGDLVEVQVSAAFPVDVVALLVDTDLKVRGDADVVFWNAPRADGVEWLPGVGPARLLVDLPRLPARIHAVLVILALPEEVAGRFGDLPLAQVVLQAQGGQGEAAEPVQVPLTGLDRERAVIAVELYRRGAGWKVRAVAQGHAEGLARLLAVHGVDVEPPPPPPPSPSPGTPGTPGTTQALPTPQSVGYSDRVWLIWEDASRALSAYRSVSEYAVQLRDDQLAAAPTGADPEQILQAARNQLDADLGQLAGELTDCANQATAALATWDSPIWLTWQPETLPQPGVLAGHVSVAEAAGLRIPLVLRNPWDRSLWVDPGPTPSDVVAFGWSLVTRYLAALPARSVAVEVIDAGAEGGLGWLHALPPAVLEGVLAGGVSIGPEQAAARLGRLLDIIDLRAVGAGEDAEAWLGGRPLRLVVVYGPGAVEADEQSLHRLLRLVEEGPEYGVPTICLDTDDAANVSLRGARLRLAGQHLPSGGGTLHDPWVRGEWAFTPEVLPDASVISGGPTGGPPALLRHVLTQQTAGTAGQDR